MQKQLMAIAASAVCHFALPLGLSVFGFYVLAILTHDLFWALAGAAIAWLTAWLTARQYALVAIGPRFIDLDHPPTWSFIGLRLLRLSVLLSLTPTVVLVVGVIAQRMTSFPLLTAMLSGIPAQAVVNFWLSLDEQSWTWRVRRGRVIQSATQIQAKIDDHLRSQPTTTDDLVDWAGLSVPAALMAANTKLLGMTESGKTVTIRQILQELVSWCLLGSNIQIVVFDPKRELYSYILGMDPKVPVFLQDGTDRRGSAPDLAADITDPNQAKTVARLLVPDENSSQPYFNRAARRILEWVLRYLIQSADHWNLQDAFMILESVELLERVLPRSILHKYFKPETTLRNTLSTLDTLTSRFETLAASWAKAEAEGRTLSLRDFAASSTSAILVIPRRLDIPDAVDPTIRLTFELLIQLWLSRPDVRFVRPDLRPRTYVILDEAAKAGSLAHLDDLLLMGRAKGVSVTIAAQDVEAIRQEYGEKIADSLLGQCGNTAVFALDSPVTREYCASLFGSFEVRHRPRNIQASTMASALNMDAKDLYHPGDLQEQKTLLPSQLAELPRPKDTGHISGYFITAGLGAHYASYPFAHLLQPPANVPVLIPRDATDQEFPEALTPADLKRLGITQRTGTASSTHRGSGGPSSPGKPPGTNSLRYIKRMTGQ